MMINPIATEAINSATYVDNYIDSVENLPDDVQRQLSRITDIDVQYRGLIRDVDHYYDLFLSMQHSQDVTRRTRTISRMHQSLIQAQELGDEKMRIVNHLQEIIDSKLRQLDQDQKNLDIRDELLQQREHLGLLEDSPVPLKQSRTQSPTRDQINGNAGNGLGINGSNGISGIGSGNNGSSSSGGTSKEHYAAYASSVGSSGGIGGGSSTPNSERSGNLSNGANGLTATNGTASGSIGIGVGGVELQRTGSKRARRRNESLMHGNNIELGGNESNSANETGSNGGERSLTQKSALSVGAAGVQKKNATNSNASGSGGAAGGSGVGINVSAGGGNNSGKKKKRKVRGGGGGSGAGGQTNAATNAREDTPPPEPIDPDEPTYCVCNQISFGEMILCDNDLCPIEWFHFSCVSLVLKPKGKWFCPNCRGERPNVMKPKAQFLKELERYNKEKEEKT